MIITLENELWWPFWYPPKAWSSASILLVSSSPSCSPKDILQTPLTSTSASVALICPFQTQASHDFIPAYNVWTWKPFASGQQLVDLGKWKTNSWKSWKQLFIDRYQDMSTKIMPIIAQPIDRPLIYEGADGSPRGLAYFIMDSLSDWLKFKIVYNLTGSALHSIIFDLVKNGEYEILINYATLTPERNRDFDLTVPFYHEGFGLILQVPPPLPRWQNIIYPFTWPVWGAIVTSLFSTAITFHLLYYKLQKSFIINTITIAQSLLARSIASVPSWWHIRCFLLLWWLASLVLNVSYTCNLIAVLTVPVFPRKLQTAQELVKSNYRLCMLDYGEFVPEALATSTNPTLFALGKKLDMTPIVFDLEELGEENCVKRVLDGSHAHIETYSFVKILYSKMGYNSDVYTMKEQIYSGYLSFVIHKHTPWSHKFNVGMQRLFETGLMQKWYQVSMDDFIGNTEEKSSELQPLSLAHLQGPFLMLTFGVSISFLVIIWEVTFSCFSNTLTQSKQSMWRLKPV